MKIEMTAADEQRIATLLWDIAKKELINNAASNETWKAMEQKVKSYADIYCQPHTVIPEMQDILKASVEKEIRTSLSGWVRDQVYSILNSDEAMKASVRARIAQAIMDNAQRFGEAAQ